MNDTPNSGPESDAAPARGPDPQGPEANPEVVERATRRRFSANYKARIVEEAAACQKQGELGALLRKEGLYSSHLSAWRKQLKSHGVDGLKAKKRGRPAKTKGSAREIELERESKQLKKRLAKAETIIAFQKKVHELLEIPLNLQELDDND